MFTFLTVLNKFTIPVNNICAISVQYYNIIRHDNIMTRHNEYYILSHKKIGNIEVRQCTSNMDPLFRFM